MSYEGGIALLCLLDIERLGVTCTFFCVMRGERCEEFQDSEALLDCRESYGLSGHRPCRFVYRRMSTSPIGSRRLGAIP